MFIQRKRKKSSLKVFFASVISVFLAVGLVGAVAVPASADVNDYSIGITAPESVGVGDGFTYTVTIDGDPVVKGAVLTATLPEGVVFEAVATGEDSPVAAYEYDPVTRNVSFVLKDLEKPLSSFNFSVTQDENEAKDESSVFDVRIEGSATSTGSVPADTATTRVTGQWGYHATKTFSTLVGSGNREVTYYFNVGGPGPDTNTFTTWAQRLSDVLPAGAEIRGTSAAPGVWTITPAADGGTSAVWQRDGRYGPEASSMTTETAVWLSVYYPPSVFPDGQLPPANTVALEVKDNSGNWRVQTPGNTQVPELGQGSSKKISLDKTIMGESETATVGNGIWQSSYQVRASYQNSLDAEKLDRLVVTDQYAGNEEFFDHMENYRMAVRFNAVLQADALPFSYEYTTNVRTSWQSFDTSGLDTGTDFLLTTQVEGSQNFQNADGYSQVLNLPAGERITGWRVMVGPGGAMISGGSQVTVTAGFIASYPSLKDGSAAPSTPISNQAVADGVLSSGAVMNQASDEAKVKVVDVVPIITVITAPSAIEVGGTAVYQAKIANLDPAGRSYQDSVMRVVLPAGVFYDPEVGVSALYEKTPTSGIQVPLEGQGLSVRTESIRVAGVERQVVVFDFKQLESVRSWDSAKDRREPADMFDYNLPVRVLPQAYDPNVSRVTAESWAYTTDQPYSGIEMWFASGYFDQDVHGFSTVLERIAKSTGTSRVLTAGGLLVGKMVRDADKTDWSLSDTVESPGRADWQIYVTNTLPDPLTDVVLFDRLPAPGDGRGSDFQVTFSGPAVANIPGVKIEYSTDATAADNGSWTESPEAATAMRLSLPAIAAGESVTVVAPTTVPEGVRRQAAAINDVKASGLYQGLKRDFVSNQAKILVDSDDPVTPPTVEPPITPPTVEPPITPPTVDPGGGTSENPSPSESAVAGELPTTGSAATGMAVMGGILLLLGLATLLLKRRGGHC